MDPQIVEHFDKLRVVVIYNAAVSHIQSINFCHLLPVPSDQQSREYFFMPACVTALK